MSKSDQNSALSREQIEVVYELYKNGQFKEAISQIKALNEIYPNVPLLFNLIGACYKSLGELDGAVNMFKTAVSLKHDYGEAHKNLGIIRKDLGQLDDALESLDKAIFFEPNYIAAIYNQAIIYKDLGKIDKAIKGYERVINLNPEFIEAHNNLGVELKEFSLLYLIMNNLDLFRENLHLVENIKLFSKENQLVLESLLLKLKSGENFILQELSLDSQLIDKIFKFASIKHILNNNQNNQEKIFELLEEISRDLKNYDLEFRIEELESKFSQDLSESTFNEIRELKKQKNIN